MATGWKYVPRSRFARAVHAFEENAIALILGLMTLLTFFNVIRRYLFNASVIWSLEVTLTLFAWLVLFGIAYGFKVTAHLGVDAVTNILKPGPRRALGLLVAAICLIYALLILKGAWDYYAPFVNAPKTTGRWFPTGLDFGTRTTSYIETDQIPIPFDWFKSWLERTFNSYMDGDELVVESYSKMPRLVPYLILPIAAVLILYRTMQAAIRIWTGEDDRMIVSHEAEDAVEEAAALNRDA